jgi:hypothetical protein
MASTISNVTQKVLKDSSKDLIPRLFCMKKKVVIFSSIYAVDRSHTVTNKDDCFSSASKNETKYYTIIWLPNYQTVV